ncbi:GLPGLI family protein [Tenacibaculum finnmarkense]|uniref:GLPGLI family protein n=2 Tax=Tenacibaculum finnmarkense TaxID=2781243 RepID=A0A2I2M7M3_9FLAO|nr:GLPGLI family protein [Tenacibaculum finnmarkense]MBE7634690.1 GLPGLI family protein [Tenacibaculum finnmarkense genomovar ulcerans]MBE7646603.1 GLPGLI family protein [Tenacibaculum finnmarkense genomovar ulcerans]MBE7698555.1 GLPGLI family protein [Tenacibaculum finnmarkense genomovar ulcerans]MCD8423424.1 GLPGLI family protein [Tenacibaculum finnmarkense genomovar ulcerans]MCD8430798.1 GLPGLI family protein [Tenacibaculum finnmarkense genomovar ulcerans]
MRILFILIILPFFCFSQSGIIKYKVIPDLKNSEKLDIYRKEIKLMSFTLKYEKEHSYFYMNKHIPLNKLYANIASVLIKGHRPWFQNNKNKEVVYKEEIKNKTYAVIHDEKFSNWELLGDTKIIEGYTCYKAVRKELEYGNKKTNIITAWYTPEIPVSYGPAGNGGLPGLILQLYRVRKGTYTVDKIILNPKQIKVPLPENSKKIDVATLIKLKRQARKVTID